MWRLGVAGEVHVVGKPEEQRGAQASAPARLVHAGRRAVAVRRAHVASRRIVRRLVMVGGLVAVGWLLGGTGQASADTLDVVSQVTDAGRHVTETGRGLSCAVTAGACTEKALLRKADDQPDTPDSDPEGSDNTSTERPAGQKERPGHRADGADQPAQPRQNAVDRTGGLKPPSAAADVAAFGAAVDNVTTAPQPALPNRPGLGQSMDVHGVVPQTSGNAGQIGVGIGDIARAWDGTRLMAVQAPEALYLPPAVRTAADEPSFSPD